MEFNPSLRIGNKFPGQAKKHKWFEGVIWENILNKTDISPFKEYSNEFTHDKFGTKSNKKTYIDEKENLLCKDIYKYNYNLYGIANKMPQTHSKFGKEYENKIIEKNSQGSKSFNFNDNFSFSEIIEDKHQESSTSKLSLRYNQLVNQQIEEAFINFEFNRFLEIFKLQCKGKYEEIKKKNVNVKVVQSSTNTSDNVKR